MGFKLLNGAQMPVIGFGTFLAKEASELEAALNKALQLGYRHIDTAWIYGNEAIIGHVLKDWFDSKRLAREDLFVTTKLPIYGVNPDRVDHYIQESLTNLQLDYVDLYLIHAPVGAKNENNSVLPQVTDDGEAFLEEKTNHEALWKKMEEQVHLGRTKAIGLSNYNIAQTETVLKSARIKPANLQVEIHVYLQQYDLITFCQMNGITVTAYTPLVNPFSLKLSDHIKRTRTVKLPLLVEDPVISKIARKHFRTHAQIAIRFLLERGLAVVPKTVDLEHLTEISEVLDFHLDEDDINALCSLDVGERARTTDFKLYLKGVEKHPDYPFPLI